MDYTLEQIEDENIISLTLYGDLTTPEAILLGKYVRGKALELNYKIVIDFRYTENHISISEAYYWFANYYDVVNYNFRRIPTAHITNEVDADFFKFVQATCQNNGIPIRLFKELEPAKHWLKEKKYK
jgi:hypothetical protein